MLLRRILKFHSEILPGKNPQLFKIDDRKFLARNQLLLLDHFISQFLQFAETKRPIKDVHLEIFQSLSEKLPIQQTVQFNFE